MTDIIKKCSYKFSNGIVVVNTTPHHLNFIDAGTGTEVVIPTSVPAGERTGKLVVNAKPVTNEVGPHLVRTVFEASPEGKGIIADIKDSFSREAEQGKLMIVGSLAAANAFRDIIGMVPAPGFERVPPAEKRMSSETFNVGDCW